MNTFIKVLLIALGIVIAVKLLPLTLAAGCVIAGAALLVLVVGVSAVAALLCVAAVLAAVLSPVWLPILVGFVAIAAIRRRHRAAA